MSHGSPTGSIANVGSTCLRDICQDNFISNPPILGFRSAISASRARKLGNVRGKPLDYGSYDIFNNIIQYNIQVIQKRTTK